MHWADGVTGHLSLGSLKDDGTDHVCGAWSGNRGTANVSAAIGRIICMRRSISSDRMWFKLQASCWSSRQAAGFLESRFNGILYVTADGHRPVTPFQLSDCSSHIANWESIVDRLPKEWDDGEYRIERYPYQWCETLSGDCDCHGEKGRLDEVLCSDFGSHDETDKRASKSENVRYQHYIRTMEERIARLDEARRRESQQRDQNSPPGGRGPSGSEACRPSGRPHGSARSAG